MAEGEGPAKLKQAPGRGRIPAVCVEGLGPEVPRGWTIRLCPAPSPAPRPGPDKESALRFLRLARSPPPRAGRLYYTLYFCPNVYIIKVLAFSLEANTCSPRGGHWRRGRPTRRLGEALAGAP